MKIIILLAAMTACTPSALQLQARAANSAVIAAREILPALVERYRIEGDDAIDMATNRADGEAALAFVRARWAPVWGVCTDSAAGPTYRCHDGAWPALRDVHDAWATMLERQIRGEPLEGPAVLDIATKVKRAFCGLRTALPAGVVVPGVEAGCVP